MREILFRGKRVDNDVWVYGAFVPDLREVYFEDEIDGFIKPFGKTKEERLMVEVDRKTVGQYTGLKDKNGKKIFEGDILHLKDENEEDYWRAIVVFGNPNGNYSWGWQLQNITPNEHVNPDILLWVETEVNYVSCEVIGNIHDNPELLGGKKNG